MDANETGSVPAQVADGVVVSIDYTLHVDGEMVDFSEKDEPLQYIQGSGSIIRGLERAMDGMVVGANKKVLVQAAEAYGLPDPSAVVHVSRAEFPQDIPLEVGTMIQVRNIDGEVLDARITDVQPDHVELDFNHPLAGKNLEFNVTVVALREASEEELEHGHVHGFGDEEDEEDDYFDEEDDDDVDEEDEDFDEEDDEEDEELK